MEVFYSNLLTASVYCNFPLLPHTEEVARRYLPLTIILLHIHARMSILFLDVERLNPKIEKCGVIPTHFSAFSYAVPCTCRKCLFQSVHLPVQYDFR